MPTNKMQLRVHVTKKEAAKVAKDADSKGMTISNYTRILYGLNPLQPGARPGNKHAMGNPGRWNKRKKKRV